MGNGTGRFHYGYLIVASCIAFCVGPSALALSCAGIFYTPVCEDLGVGRGTLALYMTVMYLTVSVFLPFAGKLFATKDARACLTGAVLCTGGAILSMSFFTAVWQFYIAGFFMGLGITFLMFVAVPTLIDRWFSKRVGFFVGICMAFTGVGGVVFNPVGGWLIGEFGWRAGYLAFGVIALAIGLPFALLVIRSNPRDKGLLPCGYEASESTDGKKPVVVVEGVSAKNAMWTLPFFMVALFAGCADLVTCIYNYLPSYVTELPVGRLVPTLSATIASAVMLGQAIGKVTMGIIADKSTKGGLLFGVVCGLVGIGILFFIPAQAPIVLVAAFLYGLYYANGSVYIPLLARSVFGSLDYSILYSRVSVFANLCLALGSSLWGFVIDGVGYDAMFVGALALVASSLVVGLVALSSAKKLPRETREIS